MLPVPNRGAMQRQQAAFHQQSQLTRPCRASAFVEGKACGEGPPRLAGSTRLHILDLSDLIARRDCSDVLEKALGRDGLGAIGVRGVPGYPAMRHQLLHVGQQLATLPDASLRRLEDPASHYSVGWSRGREALVGGRLDAHKGSYYANPLVDDPLVPSPADKAQPWGHPELLLPQPLPSTLRVAQAAAAAAQASASAACDAAGVGADGAARLAALRAAHPGYYRPNVWPVGGELPGLEGAFKALGRLVVAVGCLLLEHCDGYVAGRLGAPPGLVAGPLHASANPKGRLLHYYPPAPAEAGGRAEGGAPPDHAAPWCEWHTDHGSLTGLTRAMYMDGSGAEAPCPDPAAGLYIRNRAGDIVHVTIPPDCIAFQVGEALQVASGGLLRATPHYVRAAEGRAAAGVARNTFAVFMQPEVHMVMDCPPGVSREQVEIGQWRQGITFGEFAEATFRHYYAQG